MSETIPDEVLQAGLAKFCSVCATDYNSDDLTRVYDLNPSRFEDVVWRVCGVILKEPFSNPSVRLTNRSPTRARHKWIIDEALLSSAYQQQIWQTEILAQLSGRRQDETVPAYVLRIRYETAVGRSFRATIHAYICKDPAARAKVRRALEQANLGHLSRMLTPEGMLSASAIALAAELVQLVPFLTAASAPLIAGSAIVVGTLGLDALCSGAKRMPR